MREYIKFKNYLEFFNKDFIQQKLDEGFTIKMLSPVVNIPQRRLGEMIKYYGLSYRRSKIPIEDVDNTGLFYVYRHRRLDNDSVFYIGIGNQPNHYRARTKFGRNSHWNNVAEKYGFIYEVMYSKLSKEEAVECEIFLISLYGRYDLNEGNLVNKTDGGDMGCGYIVTDTERKAVSDRVKLGGNPRAKKIIDTLTKIVYDSIKEAAISLGIKESTMRCYVNGSMNNKTNCIYLKDYEHKLILPRESVSEKLSRKSVLNFGIYKDLPINNLLDLHNYSYLRWVYFNCSNITFMDDILLQIGIDENSRINKPGKNPKIGEDISEERVANRSFKVAQHCKKVAKIKVNVKSRNSLKAINKSVAADKLRIINQNSSK